jgi:hypothetical protein
MSDYTKSTNFTSKDSLSTGNALKIIKGAEFDTEFNNIATAVATKADVSSPALTGTPTAPTASAGTNTTQIATTAFVKSSVESYVTPTAQIADSAVTTAKINNSAVTTAKIADDAVTTAKIAASAVTTTEIAYDAVQTLNILDSNVTTSKLVSSERMNTTNVLAAFAGITAGAVGSYMQAVYVGTGSTVAFGATVPGSDLKPSNATGNNFDSAQTGSWRCMGYAVTGASSQNATTMWLRIS